MNHKVPKNLCPYFWCVVFGMLEILGWVSLAAAALAIVLSLILPPLIYLWSTFVSPLDWMAENIFLRHLVNQDLLIITVTLYIGVACTLLYHGLRYLWWEVVEVSDWYMKLCERISPSVDRGLVWEEEERKKQERREAYEQSFCKVIVEFLKSKHEKICPSLEFVNEVKKKK